MAVQKTRLQVRFLSKYKYRYLRPYSLSTLFSLLIPQLYRLTQVSHWDKHKLDYTISRMATKYPTDAGIAPSPPTKPKIEAKIPDSSSKSNNTTTNTMGTLDWNTRYRPNRPFEHITPPQWLVSKDIFYRPWPYGPPSPTFGRLVYPPRPYPTAYYLEQAPFYAQNDGPDPFAPTSTTPARAKVSPPSCHEVVLWLWVLLTIAFENLRSLVVRQLSHLSARLMTVGVDVVILLGLAVDSGSKFVGGGEFGRGGAEEKWWRKIVRQAIGNRVSLEGATFE